jgi:hypothetical protein
LFFVILYSIINHWSIHLFNFVDVYVCILLSGARRCCMSNTNDANKSRYHIWNSKAYWNMAFQSIQLYTPLLRS